MAILPLGGPFSRAVWHPLSFLLPALLADGLGRRAPRPPPRQRTHYDSHALEMPTRFAKQIWQVVRGAVAIEVSRQDALRLAIRCARDSMPPLRLAIIDDLSKKPDSSPSDARRRLKKPWHTADRRLQALHMLEVLDCDEVAYGDQGRSRWLYSLADGIHPDVLNPDVWLESSPVSAAPPLHQIGKNRR
jgi:hypothetical protein